MKCLSIQLEGRGARVSEMSLLTLRPFSATRREPGAVVKPSRYRFAWQTGLRKLMRTLEFLQPNTCRYAIRQAEIESEAGQLRTVWLFCGEPCTFHQTRQGIASSSFCAHHHEIAYYDPRQNGEAICPSRLEGVI
jgi:hypothetical protein